MNRTTWTVTNPRVVHIGRENEIRNIDNEVATLLRAPTI